MTAVSPEVRAVLDGLGLGHLSERFAAEDIDASVFWLLKDDDLRELGLTLGQRKKLLAALAARAGDGAAAATGADTGAGRPAAAEVRQGLEFRRITVLFADLVGSTELTASLALDEMHELLQAFYRAARRAARHYGGFIASLQGDGVIILFGYPQAHEGSAERAVGTALDLLSDLDAAPYRLPDGRTVPILARVGAATGGAIVGHPDAVDTDDGLQMVGPVVNRAARLQALAAPGEIVADDQTCQLAGARFGFERLPDAALKGFDAAVAVSRVVGRAHGSPAGDGAAATEEVPRSAHTAESARLLDAWRRAEAGKPGIALVTGEAGIGKSTLLNELAATAAGEGARIVRMACSSLNAHVALRPLIDHLERLVGRAEDAAPAARLGALRAALGRPADRDLWTVAPLLGLTPPEAPAGSSSAAERDRMLATLAAWLTDDTGGACLVMLEDLHWSDATTRDLMQRAAGVASGRVLLVASSRVPAEPIWEDHPDRIDLAVSRLDAEAARRVLAHHLGGVALPDDILRMILARSDGNPLMLEALARSFRTWSDADLGKDVRVPNSIYESIGARLDSLGAGKAAASAMAVFDAPTPQATLALALGIPEDELAPGLAELIERGVLERAAAPERGVLRFRHNLYREVLYERLLRADRRKLHRAVARALTETSPDLQQSRPGILAWHAAEAGDFSQAAQLALRAGEQSLARSALVEAGHNLDRAIQAVDRLNRSPRTDALRLRALAAQASIARARKGIASDEAGALGRQVLELARALGETRTELLALNGLYAHSLVRADYSAAEDWAHQLSTAAALAQDATFAMIAERGLGVVALHTGRIAPAADTLRRALDRYDLERHLPLAYAHGYDHAEICAVFLSFALWLKGDPVAARDASLHAVDHSRRIGHAHSLAQALVFRAMLLALARDTEAAIRCGSEAVELGARHDLSAMQGVGQFFVDAARLLQRAKAPGDEDLRAIAASQARFRAVNPFNYGPASASLMAAVALRAGDVRLAAGALDEAEADAARTGEVWTDPEVLRLRAEVAAAGGDAADAGRLWRRAYEAAVGMGAAGWALRIACDLAEAEPGAAASARLREARARMVSDDDGWDMRRSRRLLES